MARLNASKPTCLRGECPFKFVGSKSQWPLLFLFLFLFFLVPKKKWQLFIDAGPLIYGRNDNVG